MRIGSDWQNEVQQRWGIRVLSSRTAAPQEALWVTRCSRTKNGVDLGIPKELYISPINKYFYKCMESNRLPYGILSDKYGLHLAEEKLPYYDVHPSELSQEHKRRLGMLIRDKVLALGFWRVVFYNPSPLMSLPYFEMLYYSALDVFYTTRLDILTK
ncbi:MAG: hypothetical protein QXP27_03945 [Candidatus Methanomethyliaceae archaeon]